jgi:hypothetical protein
MLRWTSLEQIHPIRQNLHQWNAWKNGIIDMVVEARKNFLNDITSICASHHRISPSTLVAETEEDLRAQLEARIVRPKNWPQQDIPPIQDQE